MEETVEDEIQHSGEVAALIHGSPNSPLLEDPEIVLERGSPVYSSPHHSTRSNNSQDQTFHNGPEYRSKDGTKVETEMSSPIECNIKLILSEPRHTM